MQRMAEQVPRRCQWAVIAWVLLVASAAQAAAAAGSCPSITADDLSIIGLGPLLGAEVATYCGAALASAQGAASACSACHCALVRAVAPRLQQSGQLPMSEAYTSTGASALQGLLSNCTRSWALELLSANSSMTLATVAPMESCVATPKEVSTCMGSFQTGPSKNSLENIIRSTACADQLAGQCSDQVVQAWQVAHPGIASQLTNPAADPMGSKLLNETQKQATFKINPQTSSGPVAWKSGCACSSAEYAPVCEPNTRKQYPNECSARCQYVFTVVPCTELRPLVTSLRAGNASLDVMDAAPAATAFAEVAPAPAGPDTQTLYYYYDTEVEDNEEVQIIESSMVEALLGAGFNSGLQGPVEETAEQLLAAANGTRSAAAVRAQSGAADNTTDDVVRQVQLPFGVTVVARRRPVNSTTSSNKAAWLQTAPAGATAGVYTRDAAKTSRIMSALMMASTDAASKANAEAAVGAAAPGMSAVINAATQQQGLLKSSAASDPSQPVIDLLMELLNNSTSVPANTTTSTTSNTTATSVLPAVAAVQQYLNNASTTLAGLRANSSRITGLRSTIDAATEALASSGNVSTSLAVLRSGLADIANAGQQLVQAAFGPMDASSNPLLAALAGPGVLRMGAMGSNSSTNSSSPANATDPALLDPPGAGNATAALNSTAAGAANTTANSTAEGVNSTTTLDVGNATATDALNSTAVDAGNATAVDAGNTAPAAAAGNATVEGVVAPQETGTDTSYGASNSTGAAAEAPAAAGRRRLLHRRTLLRQ